MENRGGLTVLFRAGCVGTLSRSGGIAPAAPLTRHAKSRRPSTAPDQGRPKTFSAERIGQNSGDSAWRPSNGGAGGERTDVQPGLESGFSAGERAGVTDQLIPPLFRAGIVRHTDFRVQATPVGSVFPTVPWPSSLGSENLRTCREAEITARGRNPPARNRGARRRTRR